MPAPREGDDTVPIEQQRVTRSSETEKVDLAEQGDCEGKMGLQAAKSGNGGQLGVPLSAGAGGQNRQRVIDRLALAVRPVVDQRVECVAHGDNPGETRNSGAREPVGVACAVEMLVMVTDDRQEAGARAQWR